MSIILVGLNHNTAPVELREQLSLSGCGLDMALEEFARRFTIQPQVELEPTSASFSVDLPDPLRLTEAVFLSTCNRLELYVVCSETSEQAVHQSWQMMVYFLSMLQGIEIEHLAEHLYFRADDEAILHLMRVSSGLDSMILGEPQIIGQVVSAYKSAHAAGTTGPILSQLFSQALCAGKRARSETSISRFTTSISHAAARLATERLSSEKGMALSQAKILIVGAGEMAQLAGQALKMHNAENISVINRTYSSATELAAELGAIPLPWHQLDDALIAADLVITATGAPHLVIHRTEVEAALTTRQDRSMIFMDVAVPRDVDPEVSLLEGVFCYDVDDLQSTVDENMAQRQAEIPKVEAIIVQEVANMLDWISQRKVVPVIIDIRSRAKEIAEAEVADAKRRLRNLDPHAAEVAEELLERLAHRLVNKLLHQPTIQLKERATTGESADYAYMVRELFQLNSTVPLPTPSTAVEALSLQSSSLQTPA